MRTFYLAGPYPLKNEISAKAQVLEQKFGLRWHGGWDWTQFGEEHLGQKGTDNYTLAMAGGVCGDLAAATGADLFVLARYPGQAQLGGHMELGARMGTTREAHVILNGEADHMFYSHPSVTVHEAWDSFFRWMAGEINAKAYWQGV